MEFRAANSASRQASACHALSADRHTDQVAKWATGDSGSDALGTVRDGPACEALFTGAMATVAGVACSASAPRGVCAGDATGTGDAADLWERPAFTLKSGAVAAPIPAGRGGSAASCVASGRRRSPSSGFAWWARGSSVGTASPSGTPEINGGMTSHTSTMSQRVCRVEGLRGSVEQTAVTPAARGTAQIALCQSQSVAVQAGTVCLPSTAAAHCVGAAGYLSTFRPPGPRRPGNPAVRAAASDVARGRGSAVLRHVARTIYVSTSGPLQAAWVSSTYDSPPSSSMSFCNSPSSSGVSVSERTNWSTSGPAAPSYSCWSIALSRARVTRLRETLAVYTKA